MSRLNISILGSHATRSSATVVKIPRAKLHSAIHCTDYANTIRRQSHVIDRGVYSTPHPNITSVMIHHHRASLSKQQTVDLLSI